MRISIPAAAALATAAMVALAVPSAAAAAPPVHDVEVFDPDTVQPDPQLSAECGFPVTARVAGHIRYAEFSGPKARITAHPSLRTTFTGPGGSVSTLDAGLDRGTFLEGGRLAVFGTGVHLKLPDGTKDAGLWRLVVDLGTGQLVSAEYHGRFDVPADGTGAAICAAID